LAKFNDLSRRLTKSVLPQHTDHAGVMWHGSYVSWLEEQRVDTLSRVGLDYAELSKSFHLEFSVISLQIDYKIALSHGDNVFLENTAIYKKGIRVIWETVFLDSDLREAAIAKVILVLVEKSDKGFKVVRNYPDFVQKGLDSIQIHFQER
tara:strand:+ start:108 stop:557 length:450 start_codon:yes stop_codon:yes gene_type:complete